MNYHAPYLLLFTLLLGAVFAHAQSKQANNWYFGHNAWLTFSTIDDSPKAVFDGQIKSSNNPMAVLLTNPIILLILCMKTTNSSLSSLPKAAL